MPHEQLCHRGNSASSSTEDANDQLLTSSDRLNIKSPLIGPHRQQPPVHRYSPLHIAAACLVHFYTATGVLLNFYSLLHAFILNADFYLFALLNWLAILVDATDGTMARTVDVKHAAPSYDGALADNVIDFMTFSVLPALGVVRFSLVPDAFTQSLLSFCILISSAYAFCQTSETPEAFVGFPSCWNIVVFHLYYLDAPYAITVTVIAYVITSFVPIHFIYPTNTKAYMSVTLTGAYIWGVFMLFLCLLPHNPIVKPALKFSTIYVLYYIFMSLYLDRQRRQSESAET